MNRILVVDDDRNVLKVIRMRLEAEGFQIVTPRPNSEKAVAEATAAPLDLALVDLKLAEEDGIRLMEALHQINAELPIIILTAYGTIQSAVEADEQGGSQLYYQTFRLPGASAANQTIVLKSGGCPMR